MAQQGVQLDQEHFCCSICLDLLKDPVSIPCGHNYCSRCIEGYWDQDDQRGRFSCPQCRQTFNPRPVLTKNNMLAEVVESLKTTELQVPSPDHCYAGPPDVACDFCTGRKQKSVKTCLQCLVSYCGTHLEPHYQSPAFKNHKLVKASNELQENICIQQRIQEREKDVRVLHQEVGSINHCADRAVDHSDTIFTELIGSIERRRSEVRELIRDQQKRKVSRAEELRRCVEQEVTDLRRRQEKLSNIEDHVHFLPSTACLSRTGESTRHPLGSNARPLRYFEDVPVIVSRMRDKLEGILKEEGENVSEKVNTIDVLLSALPEPKTRAEFLQYSCPITLDPNTAHEYLSLSQRNRKVTWMNKPHSYPRHPERFSAFHQVLSSQSLTGRCYWEVEWSGHHVDIAVSYKDISRNGTSNDMSRFGYNDKSWSSLCCNGCYVFRHRGVDVKIQGRVSSRVGVYLDHSAGTLSWYSVSDTMTLLHRVHTTFTQTLYAGFWLGYDSTAEVCDFGFLRLMTPQ